MFLILLHSQLPTPDISESLPKTMQDSMLIPMEYQLIVITPMPIGQLILIVGLQFSHTNMISMLQTLQILLFHLFLGQTLTTSIFLGLIQETQEVQEQKTIPIKPMLEHPKPRLLQLA